MLYCIVLYCIVLRCIVMYCICLGSAFRNQVNLVGSLSAVSRSWWPHGVRGGCAAALSRYRGYRGDRICRGPQHSDMVAAAVTAHFAAGYNGDSGGTGGSGKGKSSMRVNSFGGGS